MTKNLKIVYPKYYFLDILTKKFDFFCCLKKMISTQFINSCMACTLPYINNTVSVSNIDNNKIIQNYNIPDNTDITNINICDIIYNVYTIIPEQYPQQKRFKTKRLKQPKFNTKKYHNIHQPGRTNCDQRSRV